MSASPSNGSQVTQERKGLHAQVRIGLLAILLGSILPSRAEQVSRLLSNALAVGDEMYASQRYEDAAFEYQKVVVIDPAHWRGSYQLAMSWLALYHPGSEAPPDKEAAANSIEAFERLLTIKAPDNHSEEKVRSYYVAILKATNKTDKVIAFFEERLKADPNNVGFLSQLAEIYWRKGEFCNALDCYRKRADTEPQIKEAWYTIGVVCWERVHNFGPTLANEERAQIIETGIKALEMALAIDPNYFDSLVYMGLLSREKMSALSAEMKNAEADKAFNTAEE